MRASAAAPRAQCQGSQFPAAAADARSSAGPLPGADHMIIAWPRADPAAGQTRAPSLAGAARRLQALPAALPSSCRAPRYSVEALFQRDRHPAPDGRAAFARVVGHLGDRPARLVVVRDRVSWDVSRVFSSLVMRLSRPGVTPGRNSPPRALPPIAAPCPLPPPAHLTAVVDIPPHPGSILVDWGEGPRGPAGPRSPGARRPASRRPPA